MAPQDLGEAHIPAETHAVIIRSDDAAAVVSECHRWLAAEETLFGSDREHACWRMLIPPSSMSTQTIDGQVECTGQILVHPLTVDRLGEGE